MGTCFASFARTYAALARGEQDVGTLSRTLFYDFPETCHRQGFIATILSTFPELQDIDGLRRHMEFAAEVSFQKAISAVESSLHMLEALCQCYACLDCKQQESPDVNYSRSCYLGIAYAIRDIVRTVATVMLDTQDERHLFPTMQESSTSLDTANHNVYFTNGSRERLRKASPRRRPRTSEKRPIAPILHWGWVSKRAKYMSIFTP